MARLGVEPSRTVVIGDIGSDLDAAAAGGAVGVLVPTPVTRQAEVDAAQFVAPDLACAVELAFGGELQAAGVSGFRHAALRVAAQPTEAHARPRTAAQPTGGHAPPRTAAQPTEGHARPPAGAQPTEGQAQPRTAAEPAEPREHVLVVRLDSMGDVLLAGPAVRAVAASGARVTMLCSPRGAPAARMLPGVDEVMVWDCPWISADAPAVDPAEVRGLVQALAERRLTRAVILTSFHQSPLPLALLLRMAGVENIGGASVDYAGSLLDARLRPGETASDGLPEDIAEPERALRIAAACGYRLPESDPGSLAVTGVTTATAVPPPYVVLHPGASASARRWSAEGFTAVAAALAALGVHVIVTGDSDERDLTSAVAVDGATDLGGRLTLPELAGVLKGAEVVVCGNTGPAHLAAAVGTPVVSLFSPVVPAVKWAPYGVPTVVLGDQDAACAGSRARVCPVPGHPCLLGVNPSKVVDACLQLVPHLRHRPHDTAPTGKAGRRSARAVAREAVAP
jgi:ADP-heptose:LPS heptosyltransferase